MVKVQTVFTEQTVSELFAVMQKAGLTGREMLIPEGVEEIAPGAFAGRTELRCVKLPGTLRKIGALAFYGCGLRKAILPAGTRIIRWQTFGACERLRLVYLPQAVACIEAEAFSGCTALEKVCFEAGLDEAGRLEIGADNEPLQKAAVRYSVQRERLI